MGKRIKMNPFPVEDMKNMEKTVKGEERFFCCIVCVSIGEVL